MNKNTIITLADSNYYHMLQELIDSIKNHPESKNVSICVLDAGLTEDQIKEMISGPKVGGERRAKIKKKPSKVRKAKAGGPVVKKMGGGSMNPKKYMNKGGIVKRKTPGKIGSGDKFVRDCYK